MKKVLAAVLALFVLATLFAGCKKNADRLNYNYDMSKYVDLDSYIIEVDTKSEIYQNYFNEKLRGMMSHTLTKGTVEKGDVANIDYVGKKDGVAFDGGTAEGYNLTIGSGQFIPGFEDGLIGAEIGKTVDLNLTFPESYDEASLAGKAVVFTVTVNSVSRNFDTVNDANAKMCGYESAQQVMDIAKEYAVENTAWTNLCESAKMKSYPEKENELFYNEQYSAYERAAYYNAMTMDDLASYYGMKLDELKTEIRENIVLEMALCYAVSYYVIDKEGLKVTEEIIEETKKKLDESAGEDVIEMGISKNYVEAEAVREMVLDIITENAVVKE